MAARDHEESNVAHENRGRDAASSQDSRNASLGNDARSYSGRNRRNYQDGRRNLSSRGDDNSSNRDSSGERSQRGRKNRFPRKKHLTNDDVDSSSQDETYRRNNMGRKQYDSTRSQWNQAYRGFGGSRGGQSKQRHIQRKNEGEDQLECEEGSKIPSGSEKGSMSETEVPRQRRKRQDFQNVPYDLSFPSDSGSDSGYGRQPYIRPSRNHNNDHLSDHSSAENHNHGNRSNESEQQYYGANYQGRYSPHPYQGTYSPGPYRGRSSPTPYQGRFSPTPHQGYHQVHAGRQGRFSPNPYQGRYSPTPHPARNAPSHGHYSPSMNTFDSEIPSDGLPPKGNFRSADRNTRMNSESSKKQGRRQIQNKSSNAAANSSPSPIRRKGSIENATINTETQMGVLIEQLTDGSYECPVCYECIRCQVAVWHCNNCHTVFHLKCIRKWALSQAAAVEGSDGWMCPACRHDLTQIPFAYKCFCGKTRDPQFEPGEIPHSCGEVCRGKRSGDHCNHPCTILCHPGPCPPCPANVEVRCLCERTTKTVRCSTVKEFQCEEVCGEILLCGKHYCENVCHKGNCKPCNVPLQKACFCNKKTVAYVCGSDEEESVWGVEGFSCNVPCEKPLSCGYHNCHQICHPNSCGSCSLTPEMVTHCPCGKTPISDLKGNDRDKCVDPIPVCDQVCNKPLGCGGDDNPHTCQKTCHEGKCSSCDKTTMVKCACGHRYVDASCMELLHSDKGYKLPSCDRKCTKRKHCGKHKCNKKCCTDLNHICDQVCGRKLNCGVHNCEEFCHIGNCTRCLEANFEELTCHCGAQIVEPPIACGTQPPVCDFPCARQHNCSHPVRHTCHNETQCPPCVELTSKYCLGQHELRHNLPCHIRDISCGKPCNRPLICGAHICQKTCHKGPCEDGGKCVQPCMVPRSDCGHPCNSPCHVGLACPMVWTYCKAKVELKCACGYFTEVVTCTISGADETTINQSFQRVTTSAMAGKMHNLQSGEGVDITQVVTGRRKELECNEMCAIMERNRRMAEALQIKDAELRPEAGAPGYTDFLKELARKSPSLVSGVEKELGNLVHSVQDSKFTSRSHQFPCMNRDHRRMIHELSEFYGCQTQSYDQDPNRNVVAIAKKDKSYLPNTTLTSMIQRERFPKVPMPIPHHRMVDDVRSPSPSTKLNTDIYNSNTVEKPKRIQPKEVEDFFDWTG